MFAHWQQTRHRRSKDLWWSVEQKGGKTLQRIGVHPSSVSLYHFLLLWSCEAETQNKLESETRSETGCIRYKRGFVFTSSEHAAHQKPSFRCLICSICPQAMRHCACLCTTCLSVCVCVCVWSCISEPVRKAHHSFLWPIGATQITKASWIWAAMSFNHNIYLSCTPTFP